MDIEKEQMLIKGLELKVTKKQEAIHGKSVSLGFIDRSFSLFLPKKPASKN